MSKIQPSQYQLLNAVSATSTSVAFPVNNAGRLSLMLYAGGISSGNGVFTVWVSNDPTKGFVQYNRLTSNVTNTNAQNDTRVASVTLSANTTAMVFFPPGDTFAACEVAVTRTTDGNYSAVAYVD